MQLFYHPSREEWPEITLRPVQDMRSIGDKVRAILDEVRNEGDIAVRRLTERFDGARTTQLRLTEEEIRQGAAKVSEPLKAAILQARSNIECFHAQQKETPRVIETMPGVKCWRKSVGIEKVGLYIPGGTAPLFSTLLMLGIPARLAGCKEIILCSPPDLHGSLHPAILYVAELLGITQVYRIGGVQAIGAMTYGTDSMPRVYKIFGPGNQYVTIAKQFAQMEGVAIDMPAGPSEVCVWADETANPAFVAADLLSQAEHGADSQVLLVTTHAPLAGQVMDEVQKQTELLPRKDLAERSLSHSRIVVVRDREEALELVNTYAAEHLIISCAQPQALAEAVINAGSVFIGNYSPESAGDYASGTNHTLPTNGFARAYSGVSLDSFVRKITYQELSREGLERLGPTVVEMATAEGLEAHARAVQVRLNTPS